VFASTVGAVTGVPWRVEIAAKLDDINSKAKIATAEMCLGTIFLASAGQ
jgi:hypothetical protein